MCCNWRSPTVVKNHYCSTRLVGVGVYLLQQSSSHVSHTLSTNHLSMCFLFILFLERVGERKGGVSSLGKNWPNCHGKAGYRMQSRQTEVPMTCLTSARSHFHPECTRSQQNLILTEAVTCCTYAPQTAVFLVTQNGSIVSGFPSSAHFRFGYVRYCISSNTYISKSAMEFNFGCTPT